MTPDNWLATAEQISRILSIAAIPIVLGVGGWLIQRQLQDQSIRRDYVQLALSILQSPDPTKVPPEIRAWAVDLLNANAPTKLNAQALRSLKSGAISLPSFNFVPSSALTPALKETLEKSLEDFQKHLVLLGFTVPKEAISVAISPGTTVKGTEGVAFWDPETNSIQVASAFASDKESVLRQFVHAVLAPPVTAAWDYLAIESGVASYFPCSFTNHPVVGGDASDAGKSLVPAHDLRDPRKVSAIKLARWDSVQNDGSAIWGGILWQVRELLGPERADQLIADTWRALPSTEKKGHGYVTFVSDLLAKTASLDDGKHTTSIRELFKQRGIRI